MVAEILKNFNNETAYQL